MDITCSNFQDMLQGILGSEEYMHFLSVYEKGLKKSITINTQKISVQDFYNLVEKMGWKLTKHFLTEKTNNFYVDRDDVSVPLGNTFLHQAGFFYIQEVAASVPVSQISLQGGDVILDMCAAPGGKSSQIANLLLKNKNANDHGILIANDVSVNRIKSLKYNLYRGGCYNTCVTRMRAEGFGSLVPNFFDHVLLDAPCSGEGTAFRGSSFLRGWNRYKIKQLCGLQYKLLLSALYTVKVGGSVIYATCTLNPFENEGVISKIVRLMGDHVSLEIIQGDNLSLGVISDHISGSSYISQYVRRLRPHIHHTGGFFIAKITKRDVRNDKQSKLGAYRASRGKRKFLCTPSFQKKIHNILQKYWGIFLDPQHYIFVQEGKTVFLVTQKMKSVIDAIDSIESAGIPILKISGNIYLPLHGLGNTCAHIAKHNVYDINDYWAQKYSEGRDIFFEDDINIPDREYGLLTRKGYPFGVTKRVGNTLKNKRIKQ